VVKSWELLRNYMDTLDLIQFGAEDEELIAFQEWKYHDLYLSVAERRDQPGHSHNVGSLRGH
jgi:hypothetical protein